MVYFVKYERAHNAAVRISDLWPDVCVRNHSGTKHRKKTQFRKSFFSDVSGRLHTRLPGKQFTASRTEAKHVGAKSTDRLNIRDLQYRNMNHIRAHSTEI